MNTDKKEEFSETPSNENIFTKIYETNKWKEANSKNLNQPFYSGPGSYGTNADMYVELISNFIKKHNIESVTDIGCGDFAIARKIVSACAKIHYNGCDVVKDLVSYNNDNYSSELVKFYHLDAARDKLPVADILTIRQVFQHLSNDQISKILINAKSFKYIIVTEHLLKEGEESSFNKDKKTSDGFRLSEGSGIYLDKPPFNLQWQELLSCPSDIFVEDSRAPNDYIPKRAFIKTFLITSQID